VSSMTLVETFLGQPAARAIGWALLHFVWQGALIGGLTYAALTLLRRSAADVRYVVSTIAMSLMLTMPLVTGAQFWRAVVDAPDASGQGTACADGAGANCEQAGPPLEAPVAGVALDPQPAAAPAQATTGLSHDPIVRWSSFESWLPVLVLSWLCGVAALTMRLMSGWVWVQRMKSHGTSPAAERWNAIASRLSRRLHIARPVRLLQSTLVDVPTVIGWFKPVVLLPASTLAGLAPDQLEAILAHELAHIRRHDYLVNLLQTVVETLLFYHPAVWWLSKRIRAERENCCDDLAVGLCGDPVTYARALADLEELRGAGGGLVMAANGGSLVQRISRLLGAPTHAGRAPGWLAGGATIVLMSGIAASAVGTDAFQWSTVGVAASASSSVAVSPSQPASNPDPRIPNPGSRIPDPESRVGSAEPGTPNPESRIPDPESRIPDPESRVATAEPGTPNSEPRVPNPERQPHRTFSWSNDGEKLQVTYDGEAEFTDDDADVKSMSPGALLRIKDGWLFPSHTVEFSLDDTGNIRRRYWAGMSERPFDPEGRQWIAAMLPRFIRQTGIGAPARVARILKAKGTAGVLAEIGLIEGSFGKKVYFTELLKAAPLDSAAVRQVLAQASREIDSDFELATLLIDSSDRLMVDEPSRQAYFEAARTIDSDFEMRRVFSSALKRGGLSPAALAALLAASRNVDSDFEEASLLVDVAKSQPLDSTTGPLFFSALATVGSDFEHRRVLDALAERQDLTPETTVAMLGSSTSVQSDFEAASFLVGVAGRQPIEGTMRAPFFRAAESIGSSFERGRVLQAVMARADASPDTVVAALRSAAGMDSGFERSNVLIAAARSHTLEGPARDAYIDAAEKLGDFEQGKALAALVKNERRK
jgi:beta-lactamase regulating signal transducer with metallopeptidase domain